MNKTYRKGAVGAMMDEYERAAAEFRSRIAGLTEEQYTRIAGVSSPHVSKGSTVDEEPLLTCGLLTPQTIMSHVVAAGYGYADYIRKAFSLEKDSPERRQLAHRESLEEFDAMLAYTVATLDDKWEMPEDEFTAVSMTVHWGPSYDLEQLLEHAIVHTLRHRRQFDKWGLAESVSIVTDRDRDTILQLLDSNVEPNESLKVAAQIYRQLIIE